MYKACRVTIRATAHHCNLVYAKLSMRHSGDFPSSMVSIDMLELSSDLARVVQAAGNQTLRFSMQFSLHQRPSAHLPRLQLLARRTACIVAATPAHAVNVVAAPPVGSVFLGSVTYGIMACKNFAILCYMLAKPLYVLCCKMLAQKLYRSIHACPSILQPILDEFNVGFRETSAGL
jgi:hypothetical protein